MPKILIAVDGSTLALDAVHHVLELVRDGLRTSVVLASAMGGALLLAADILARGLLAPQELPVGVVTALLGGSYLLVLMYQRRMRDLAS